MATLFETMIFCQEIFVEHLIMGHLIVKLVNFLINYIILCHACVFDLISSDFHVIKVVP